jgi:hypothetical protein
MNLDEFIKRLKALKAMGYVKSMRKGPTGIGFTFESYVGIKENNLALPDIEGFEIKAHRNGSDNLITLFTFNRGAWIMNPIDAVKKYGTKDKNGRKGLYFTMSRSVNSAGLYLDIDAHYVSVKHIDGNEIAKWSFDDIAEQFKKKIPGLILIHANVEMRNETEWFNFYSAKLLNGTTPEKLKQCIMDGTVLIDLRLHDKGTMARNHGTGFRVYESQLEKVFEHIETLL